MRRYSLRRHSTVLSAVALCFSLGSFPCLAQDAKGPSAAQSDAWYNPKRYNPLKLLKRDSKSASDRLATDGNLELKLTHQLQAQGILPQDKHLLDACSDFKQLADCVASLRVSSTLKINFSCLKWDVTGVKPKPVADSCAGPAGGKAMGLYRSIDLLKPDANAKSEARNALRIARVNIKDASD
jgi:hypothetical protein